MVVFSFETGNKVSASMIGVRLSGEAIIEGSLPTLPQAYIIRRSMYQPFLIA
jgi:hypothetical protein